jgi:dTMP kinase
VRSKFITLEGIEGSGKSTNLKFINEYLDKKNISYVNSREPGGGPIGAKLRSLLLDVDSVISPEVEMLLMLSDRKDHVDNLILPNLNNNKWVISDRYMDSTIAYQGGGREIDLKKILATASILNLPEPSLTLLFDLPIKIALERAKQRGNLDRFESEPEAFHQRIRDAYINLSQLHPNRIKVIDSSQSKKDVKLQLLGILDLYFEDNV